MTKITFPLQHETSVYINGNMAISIVQPGQDHDDTIVLNSKQQAIDVAQAILALAETATFTTEDDQ